MVVSTGEQAERVLSKCFCGNPRAQQLYIIFDQRMVFPEND